MAVRLATADLVPGTYSWRVRAKYVEGGPWSEWSDAGSFINGQMIQVNGGAETKLKSTLLPFRLSNS